RNANDLEGMKEAGQWFVEKFGPDDSQSKLIKAIELVTEVRIAQAEKIAPTQNEIVLGDSERQKLRAARGLLNDIKAMRSGWHEHPKLLAEINMLEGQIDEAIANLQEALKLGPANSTMIRQLVQLLYHRN